MSVERNEDGEDDNKLGDERKDNCSSLDQLEDYSIPMSSAYHMLPQKTQLDKLKER